MAARAPAVTALGAILFTVFSAVTTQVAAVRAASPWQDDPYDAVVTFTMFFVPGLSAVAAFCYADVLRPYLPTAWINFYGPRRWCWR